MSGSDTTVDGEKWKVCPRNLGQLLVRINLGLREDAYMEALGPRI
jgi:hypothetical protein